MKLHRVVTSSGDPYGYLFWCPGCDEPHRVGETWTFNSDLERPTFSPSILVTHGADDPRRCHSFIRDGLIEFCADSTHVLAGQSVDLPDMDEWKDEESARPFFVPPDTEPETGAAK